MFIFRIEMHKKSLATLEVNFPCHRITLRAEKALRVILSCEHFSDQNTQIFPGRVDARFSVIPNYSKSSEGSTSHFEKSLPEGSFGTQKNCCNLPIISPYERIALRAKGSTSHFQMKLRYGECTLPGA